MKIRDYMFGEIMKLNLTYLLLPLSIMVCISGNYSNAMEGKEEINTSNNNIIIRERIQNIIDNFDPETLISNDFDDYAAYYAELNDILEKDKQNNITLSSRQLEELEQLEDFLKNGNNNINESDYEDPIQQEYIDQNIEKRIADITNYMNTHIVELTNQQQEDWTQLKEANETHNYEIVTGLINELEQLEVKCNLRKDSMTTLSKEREPLTIAQEAVIFLKQFVDFELNEDEKKLLDIYDNEIVKLESEAISNQFVDTNELSKIEQKLISFIGKKVQETNMKQQEKYSITERDMENTKHWLQMRINRLKVYLASTIKSSNNTCIYQMFLNQLNRIISSDAITYNQLNALYNMELYILLYPINNEKPSYNNKQSNKLEGIEEALLIYKSILNKLDNNKDKLKIDGVLNNIKKFLDMDDKLSKNKYLSDNLFKYILENFVSNEKPLYNKQQFDIIYFMRQIRKEYNNYELPCFGEIKKVLSYYEDIFKNIKRNYNTYLLHCSNSKILSELTNQLINQYELDHNNQTKIIKLLQLLLFVTLRNNEIPKDIIKNIINFLLDKKSLDNNIKQNIVENVMNSKDIDIDSALEEILRNNIKKLVNTANQQLSEYNTTSKAIDYLFTKNTCKDVNYDETINRINIILDIMFAINIKKLLDKNSLKSDDPILKRMLKTKLHNIIKRIYSITKQYIVESLPNTMQKNSSWKQLLLFVRFFEIQDKIDKAFEIYITSKDLDEKLFEGIHEISIQMLTQITQYDIGKDKLGMLGKINSKYILNKIFDHL